MARVFFALVLAVTALFSLAFGAAIPENEAKPTAEIILNAPPTIITNMTLEEEALLKLASLEIQEEEKEEAGIPVADLNSISSDSSESAENVTTIREKRTIGILSRAFCNIFYRNSVSDCPVGRRFRTEDTGSVSAAQTQNQDDFWLNYLNNNNNETGDAVFVPTTESSYYPPAVTSARPLAWLKSLLGISPDSHPIRNTFRTLFPRLSSFMGGGSSSSTDDSAAAGAVGRQSPLQSWWSRLMSKYRRVRAGVRGFREGWRNEGGSGGYGSTVESRPRTGGLDLSSLLNTIDIGALLNQIQT